MAKLTILKGLPASGKSTLARQRVNEEGNTARLNRDSLREMLFNGKWSGYKEKIVIAVEKAIAAEVLAHNFNVVIDDTNLRKDIWSNFNTLNLTEREQVDLTKVPLSLCIQRDRVREKRVGRPIIERMALEAGLIDFKDELGDEYPIVICDIDGTIADLEHRVHYMRPADGEKKDHAAFYGALDKDTPIVGVITWVRALSQDHLILLFSGRGEEYAKETEDWLLKFGPPYDYCFMRRSGDHRDDTIVKNLLLDELLKYVPLKRIAFAIDDRPRVVEGVWRARGIKVYPVGQDRWQDTAEYVEYYMKKGKEDESSIAR